MLLLHTKPAILQGHCSLKLLTSHYHVVFEGSKLLMVFTDTETDWYKFMKMRQSDIIYVNIA